MAALLKTVTLGCKVNQYETQLVREGLLRSGYRQADDDQPADLCIVNTCTVTAEGDSKSRQVIRRMHRQNPNARIVVMGCYATRAPQDVARLAGVAEVVTNKRELPDLMGRFGVIDIPSGISGLSNRHRAYVKVQDGCLLKCTYCIIPTVRPEMYSRAMADVLDEVRRLADRGFKEVVLTGIHLGHYGVDLNRDKSKRDWTRLSHLVRAICQVTTDIRVRLSSIEATEITRELIGVMREHADRVCPHLHVCLQSGSDYIFAAMRRRWTRKHIIDRCNLIRQELDEPAFTTDVIVGFPGESDKDFDDTVDACRQIGFSKIHKFPFSARQGTPAAEMEDPIPKHVKAERGKAISELEIELRREYFERLVGKELTLLAERYDTQTATLSGTSCRYAPVVIESSKDDADVLDGQLVRVCVDDARDEFVSGRPIRVEPDDCKIA